MLIKAKELQAYKLDAIDGEIGNANEFYFDDQYWAVRYLVADTRNWLTGRQVLISPYALVGLNKEAESINIDLTRNQIENSPSLSSDKPVSRQFEADYYGYYSWPAYWKGLYMWGKFPDIMRDSKDWKPENEQNKSVDSHLRSTNAVSGYYIQANNGEIGHVVDFIIDDMTWAIRYLIIDTTNWFAGRKVLISPKWIDSINWNDSKVFINLSMEDIKNAPNYSEEALLTRDYETQLHKYYKHNVYWSGKPEDIIHAQ